MIPPPFRYRSLGYVALNVSDLERSRVFYRQTVGLEEVAASDDAVFLRCSADHHDIVLYRGLQPGLKRVAWELERMDDLDRAFEHFSRADLNPWWLTEEERDALDIGPAFRLREPTTELCFEYYARMRGITTPLVPGVTVIERVGHVVLTVRDIDAVLGVLTGPLNFRVSDEIDGVGAFLRCFPNPLHHTLAVQQSKENRLHHVNFMVRDIDDVGRALNCLRDTGVPIVFGPGRHQPSDSIFLYFLDPDGLTLEYSFGMEEFPEDGARTSRMFAPTPASIDLWGGRPEPGFGAIGSIETAAV